MKERNEESTVGVACSVDDIAERVVLNLQVGALGDQVEEDAKFVVEDCEDEGRAAQ